MVAELLPKIRPDYRRQVQSSLSKIAKWPTCFSINESRFNRVDVSLPSDLEFAQRRLFRLEKLVLPITTTLRHSSCVDKSARRVEDLGWPAFIKVISKLVTRH